MQSAILQLSGDLSIEKVNFIELKGGMTSTKLYTFEIIGQKYVLRILNDKQSLESRQNEIAAHRIAASMGIAPELNYVDKDYHFMIMPFIKGHTLKQVDLQDNDIIETLGKMIGKLHHYKGEFNQTRTQVDRARKHYEKAIKKEIAFPSIYKNLYNEYIAESENLNKINQVLCHADLNPANILISDDGDLYIIDWTSTTWDNSYTDLGYFTFLNGLDENQSKIFLKAYFGREPTKEEWKQLKLAQKRTSFLTSTVWFDFSESKQDKLVPLEDRLEKVNRLLKSENIRLGQDYIAKEEIISPLSGQHEALKLYALGFLKTYITFEVP